jgi:hypothetical protein
MKKNKNENTCYLFSRYSSQFSLISGLSGSSTIFPSSEPMPHGQKGSDVGAFISRMEEDRAQGTMNWVICPSSR